jgi:leucyl-tRNA synthetase
MVVHINVKVRDRIDVDQAISEDAAIDVAMGLEKIRTELDGASPKRVISRPPKLVNIVV